MSWAPPGLVSGVRLWPLTCQGVRARAVCAIRRSADVLAAAAGVTWTGEGLRDDRPGICQQTGPAHPGRDR